MLAATVLKFFVEAWASLCEFVVKYWPQILLVFFCIALVFTGYRWGYQEADTKWIVANNKSVKDLNDHISSLELLASSDLTQYNTNIQTLKDRLNLIAQQAPTIVAHDSTGKKMVCDGKTQAVFLGPEFKDAWNALNAESNKK